MGIKLSDIKDPKLRNVIASAPFWSCDPPMPPGYGSVPCAVKVGLTKDQSKLNKTEKAFHDYLCALSLPWVSVQSITLKLGDDCRYTPDFAAVNADGSITFYEVKGFWRDDAKVKIKVAARLFRWAKFVVVQKNKNAWTFQDINP